MNKMMVGLAMGGALALGAAANAQEVVRTGDPAAAAAQDQAIAEWGRRVMAGQSTADLDAPKRDADGPARPCPSVAADGKPHGEVWGGIGTHGYRDVGAVVTQPLGKCAALTIAVEHVEGGGGRPRRR